MHRTLRVTLLALATTLAASAAAAVLIAKPLTALPECPYTSQPACGCAQTATNPVTGATCTLSSWSCGSSGNVCEQECSYVCN